MIHPLKIVFRKILLVLSFEDCAKSIKGIGRFRRVCVAFMFTIRDSKAFFSGFISLPSKHVPKITFQTEKEVIRHAREHNDLKI